MYITPERSVLVSKVTKRDDVYDTGSESLRLILDDGVDLGGVGGRVLTDSEWKKMLGR